MTKVVPNKPFNGSEMVRITISIGIVAAAIAFWAVLDSIGGTIILKLISAVLAFFSFTYVMLTAVQHKYTKEPRDESKFMKLAREKSYNASISFYWYSLLMIALMIVSDTFHISSTTLFMVSVIATAAMFLTAGIIFVVKKIRRWAKVTSLSH